MLDGMDGEEISAESLYASGALRIVSDRFIETDTNDIVTQEEYESLILETNRDVSSGKFVSEEVDSVTLSPFPSNEFIGKLRYTQRQNDINLEDLLQLQKYEFKRNPGYQKTWEMATKIFQLKKDKGEITHMELDREAMVQRGGKSLLEKIPIEYHIALICYTLEFPRPTPFYKMFNHESRNLRLPRHWYKFPFKSFHSLLLLAVNCLNSSPRRADEKFACLYRGVKGIHYEEADVGKIIGFTHFLSTTFSSKVAETFCEPTKKNDVVSTGTLFEIHECTGHTKEQGRIGVQHYSISPWEEEVLIWPYFAYQIVKITKVHQDLVRIQLRCLGEVSSQPTNCSIS